VFACIYDDGRCCKGVKTVMWVTAGAVRTVDERDDAYSWRRRWSACVRACCKGILSTSADGYNITAMELYSSPISQTLGSPTVVIPPLYHHVLTNVILIQTYSVSAKTTDVIYVSLRNRHARCSKPLFIKKHQYPAVALI